MSQTVQINTHLHKQFLKDLETKYEYIPMFTSAGPGDNIILSALPKIIYKHYNKKVNIYRKITVPDDRGGYIESWRNGAADDEYIRINKSRTLPIFENNPYVNEEIFLVKDEWENVKKKILYGPLQFSFMHEHAILNNASMYGIYTVDEEDLKQGVYFSEEEEDKIHNLKNRDGLKNNIYLDNNCKRTKPILLFRSGPDRWVTKNKYYHYQLYKDLYDRLKDKFYIIEVGPDNVGHLDFLDQTYKFSSLRDMFCLIKASFCMISPESGLSSIPRAVGADRFVRLWYEDPDVKYVLAREKTWYEDKFYKSFLINPDVIIPEVLVNNIVSYLDKELEK